MSIPEANTDNAEKHIDSDGSRGHVTHWTGAGPRCSEPNCEVNAPDKLDPICERILGVLSDFPWADRHNAAMSIKDLTSRMKVSLSAVRSRMPILVEAGLVRQAGIRESRGRPESLWTMRRTGQ